MLCGFHSGNTGNQWQEGVELTPYDINAQIRQDTIMFQLVLRTRVLALLEEP